jgi:hypothetical protein
VGVAEQCREQGVDAGLVQRPGGVEPGPGPAPVPRAAAPAVPSPAWGRPRAARARVSTSSARILRAMVSIRVKAAVMSSARPVTASWAMPSGSWRRVQPRRVSACSVRLVAPCGSARSTRRVSRAVSWVGVSCPAGRPGRRSASAGTLPGVRTSASTAAASDDPPAGVTTSAGSASSGTAWSGGRWRTASVIRRARVRSIRPSRNAWNVAGRRSTGSTASSSRSRATTGDSHSASDTSWAV